MRIFLGRLLVVVGLTFCLPGVVRAEAKFVAAAGQHESPEHDSNKSMKAYKKMQKKNRKQAKKADKRARKRAKQQRQSG